MIAFMLPPKDPPLFRGDKFVIRTGRRKILYSGDCHYFQKDNRRYFCRVLSVHHERYRTTRFGEPAVRCKCEVEVISR